MPVLSSSRSQRTRRLRSAGRAVAALGALALAVGATIALSPPSAAAEPALDLQLTPVSGSSPIGGFHTVTATVLRGGEPLPEEDVFFDLTGQNRSAVGRYATDSSGRTTYTYPDTYGAGDDIITARIDGTDVRATAEWTWTPSDTAPTATPQSLSTDRDSNLSITLTGTGPGEVRLTYRVLDRPTHGKLYGGAPDLVYVPDPGFEGNDSFTYTTSDGTLTSAPATVSIAVEEPGVNRLELQLTPESGSAPIGGSHTVTATVRQKGEPVSGTYVYFSYSGVNRDQEGECTTYACRTDSSGRTGFTYDDTYGAGDDTITARADNGSGSVEAVAQWTWTVPPGAEPPTADPQSVQTDRDTTVGVSLSGSSPRGGFLHYSLASRPDHGSLDFDGFEPQYVRYVPDDGFVGDDSFTFTVNDGALTSAEATISITVVKPPNSPPSAFNGAASTTVNTPVAVTLNPDDVDRDPLTYDVGSPAHGTLSGTAPKLTYTPDRGFRGSDEFSFTVNDGEFTSNRAVVTIDVKKTAAGNHRPFAQSAGALTRAGQPVSITLRGTDQDGDPLQYTVGGVRHGALTGSGTSRTYTPKAGYQGADSFTYTVNDGITTSAPATVRIGVVAAKP